MTRPKRVPIPFQTRKRIWLESDKICQMCGSETRLFGPNYSTPFDRTPPKANIDHIKPVYHGGGNEEENLQLLCQSCNMSKGKKWNPENEVEA